MLLGSLGFVLLALPLIFLARAGRRWRRNNVVITVLVGLLARATNLLHKLRWQELVILRIVQMQILSGLSASHHRMRVLIPTVVLLNLVRNESMR